MTNVDTLYEQASLRGVDDRHCCRCKHCYAGRKPTGYFIETCHHPYLEIDDWPVIDRGLVCDWFAAR